MTVELSPISNPSFLSIETEDLYSAEECDRIAAGLEPDQWRPALVTDNKHGRGLVRPEVRSVLQQGLRADQAGWPVSQLADAIRGINDRVFRFDLNGFDDIDYPTVLRYEAEVEDHFARHTDSGPAFPNRKLTCVVQLSDPNDYRGGDLLFPDAGFIAPRNRGLLIVFPAFVTHQVTPVVSGTRHVIVGWVGGPTFR